MPQGVEPPRRIAVFAAFRRLFRAERRRILTDPEVPAAYASA
jgi:hypothetical protein